MDIHETSEFEVDEKKELDRNKDDTLGDCIKTSCTNREDETGSNYNDNVETKPHASNINEKEESDIKIKTTSNDTDKVRRGLMSVKEVKKAGKAFRGSNISNVKGYTGMRVTPVDVKNKLSKTKR